MRRIFRITLKICCFLPVLLVMLCHAGTGPLFAGDIIAEWGSVRTPPPPSLKEVTVDPVTTALLMLDFNKQTCNSEKRPRCIDTIPGVKRLLNYARTHRMLVIFSLSPGAHPADISKELSPAKDEPVVCSGPDKFLGTELALILLNKGIKTVIVVGTAAHGAVLYTASTAALRGMNIIIPVDGMSAENPYAEQYVAWNFLNAPRISALATLTRIDMINIGKK